MKKDHYSLLRLKSRAILKDNRGKRLKVDLGGLQGKKNNGIPMEKKNSMWGPSFLKTERGLGNSPRDSLLAGGGGL